MNGFFYMVHRQKWPIFSIWRDPQRESASSHIAVPTGVFDIHAQDKNLLTTTREGNVFARVCDSVHNRPHGYSVTAHPCYGVVGTHPTRMRSCYTYCYFLQLLFFFHTCCCIFVTKKYNFLHLLFYFCLIIQLIQKYENRTICVNINCLCVKIEQWL